MCDEGHILCFGLSDQHPVKRIMVGRSTFGSYECLQRKHMPVAHLDRQKTGILAKTGQVFPCE